MKKTKVLHQALLLMLLVFSIPSTVLADDTPKTLRRFAFVVGSNDGGPQRVTLAYAHTDAKAMSRVLRQLGGVSRPDSVMILEPNRYGFEAGLSRVRNKLETAATSDARLELIFYYSGHSDENGLLLGEDLITYRELREYITKMPADVRIAILDSCASGALTRGKGGKRTAPFLVDTSVDVKGYAYLTSASADEAAQESDRIGGSFFTHYLVSGLRGAADSSQDGKITLNEAYQYAFDETLQRTESTQAGPQHPNYDFRLAGSGDLVLTDLRGTSAALELDATIDGRVFIRDRRGNLVAEINKKAGEPMTMGLESGEYDVVVENQSTSRQGTIIIQDGTTATIEMATLSQVTTEQTVARGDTEDEDDAQEEAFLKKDEFIQSLPEDVVKHPVSLGIFPGLGTDAGADGPVLNNFRFNLFVGMGDYLSGVELGYLGNIRTADVRGVQAGGIFNYTHGRMSGIQGAGIMNFTRQSFYGVQGAGIANITHGPVKGLQGSGIANINTGGSSYGFQGAGIINYNQGSSGGFQGAGLANVNAGFSSGFQGAGIANINLHEQGKGFQGAGIVNVTESLRGVQWTGIANVAHGDLEGAQLGLINYGTNVTGAQIGLINVAKDTMTGPSVGLINYSGDGFVAPTFWTSDTSAFNLGLKFGTRFMYTILGAGIQPFGDEKFFNIMAGVGGHLELGRGWLELDLIFQDLHDNYDWSGKLDLLAKTRLVAGIRIRDRFSVYGGISLNCLFSEVRSEIGIIPAYRTQHESFSGHDVTIKSSIGLLAGIQFDLKRAAPQKSPEDKIEEEK